MRPPNAAARPAPTSPNDRSPLWTSRALRGPTWWQATLAVGALFVLLASSSSFATVALSSAPSGSATATDVTSSLASISSTSPPGASELQQASSSLEHGAGPARGDHVDCAGSASSGSVACGSGAATPSSASLPSLSWNPVGTPIGRESITMVWDPADGYVVLFGGSDDFGDTWIFTRGTWVELHPTISPTPRSGAYMVWDSRDGYVLMFGGYTGSTGPSELGDTWAFSDGQWTELIPQSACTGNYGTEPCPFARDSGEIADDPADGYVVLFSDYYGDQDTWTYAAGHWTDLIPLGSCAPSACPPGRGNGVMAYDPTIGGDVLFGGYPNYNDTWEFLHGSWVELIAPSSCTGTNGGNPCPPESYEMSMTYDSETGDLVMLGNYSSPDDTTWIFNGVHWQEDTFASNCELCPEGRSDPGLVDDPTMGGVLMFGGYPYLSDTWLLYQGNWSPVELSGTPGARWDASMTYDPTDNEVVLLGGFLGTTALDGTWTFSNGAWTELACGAACPSARAGAAIAWDARDGYVLLFGGQTTWTGSYERDTWSFVGGAWTEVNSGTTCTPTTCPTARSNASMAWDGSDNEIVLFGGFGAGSTYDNDTWSYAGGTWAELIDPAACTYDTSNPCPSAREEASVASAPLPEQGVVLFGGSTATGLLNDTWLFHDGVWSEVDPLASCSAAPGVCPSERQGAAMAYDPTINMVVLFGGLGSKSHGDDDTWIFDGSTNSWTQDKIYGASDRGWASMAFDPSSGNLLLAGGWYKYGNLPDTWFLSTGVKVLKPTASPASIDLGETVTFSDQASGGGSGTPWFSWQGLPTGCAYPANGASTVSCTPTTNGTFYPSTVVTYPNGEPGETSVISTFTVNTDPAVTITANESAAYFGHEDNLTANATGGSGLFTQYHWWGLPPDCLQPYLANASILCKPLRPSDLGTWQVTVSVVDSSGYNVTSQPFALVVESAPWSVAVQLAPSTIDLGQSVNFATVVQGALGPFTYTWNGLPPGCSGTMGTVLCTPTSTGTYAISATLANPTSGTATSSPVTLSVLSALGMPALTASSSSVVAGSALSLAVTISGGEAPYSYLWSGLPTGCLAADADEISCAPTIAGSSTVSVMVMDATGALSTAVTASITVTAVPIVSPWSVVLSSSVAALDLGQSVTLSAMVEGSGGASLSYTWLGLPSGVSASGSSVSFTPTATGSYFIAVQVSAPGEGSQTSNTVGLSVSSSLSSTATVSVSSSSVQVGSTLTIAASVLGGTAPYTYSWSDVPSGCPTANSPVLTCVPTSAGSYNPTVTVTDAVGGTTHGSVGLTVVPAPAPASGFAVGASDLDWTIFLLVLIVALIAVGSLILSLRQGGSPPARRRPEWDEGPAPSPPARPSSPSSPTPGSPPAASGDAGAQKPNTAPAPGPLAPAPAAPSGLPASSRGRFAAAGTGTLGPLAAPGTPRSP